MRQLGSGLFVPDDVPGYTDKSFTRARMGARQDFVDMISEKPDLWVSSRGRSRALKRMAGGGNQPYTVYWPPVLTSQTAITGTAIALAWPVSPYSNWGANTVGQGQMFQFEFFGTMTSAASTPGTLTLTPIWGTTTGGTNMGASAASPTMTASGTGAWFANGMLIARTVSPVANSGSAVAIVSFQPPSNILAANMMAGGVVTTVDTSTAQGFGLGVTMGSASDSLQTLGGFFASLN